MKEKCVICGKMTEVFDGDYLCVTRNCNAKPFYCTDCACKHIIEIRCPRHFLKSHREDRARHKKEALK